MRKLEQLRNLLNEYHVDGLLITNSMNRRYITNFTGSSGVVLVTNSEAILITDFRYIEQAEEQAKHFKIVQHEGQIEEVVEEQITKLNIQRLGFEQDYVTYTQYEIYQQTFTTELKPTKGIVESLRIIKDDEEVNILKKAAQIADQAFEHIMNFIKPGVREIEIANELEFFMRKQGATSSSFDIIVASGYRSALPHGVASEKKIAYGELVTLDFGALYEGYCSDITRTVAVGEIDNELKNIYHVVLEAQKRGIEGIKPNMTGKDADALTRNYIEEKGFGEYFGHSTGHGIGLEIHENPSLSTKSEIVLQKNMVVTVEPGIYVPNVGGCRIEDDIVLTENGNERLTLSTKELIQL